MGSSKHFQITKQLRLSVNIEIIMITINRLNQLLIPVSQKLLVIFQLFQPEFVQIYNYQINETTRIAPYFNKMFSQSIIVKISQYHCMYFAQQFASVKSPGRGGTQYMKEIKL